jgi:ABC-type arginine transport system ATPase subunit
MFKTVVKDILMYLLNRELEKVSQEYNANPNITRKQNLYTESVKIKALADKLDSCKR